jgi:LemA protein
VTRARTALQQATTPGSAADANEGLTAAIGRLFAVAEAYPDLQAAASFAALQRTLSEVEDHLQNARRYYNAVVRDLNIAIAQFPAILVARLLRFQPREFFGLDDESERAVPQVETGA